MVFKMRIAGTLPPFSGRKNKSGMKNIKGYNDEKEL
jgi:hypothetical protein